jgi:hypothetical protein
VQPPAAEKQARDPEMDQEGKLLPPARHLAIVASLIRAELVFAKAQCEVAIVPITSPADLHGMAVASAKYDRVDLARVNRGLIGLMVADEIAGLRKAVLS